METMNKLNDSSIDPDDDIKILINEVKELNEITKNISVAESLKNQQKEN